MPTVNALALQLIREQDEASDDSDYVATVEQWIQDAIDEFASAADWRLFKETISLSTVASTDTYELPFRVAEIRSMRFVDTDEEITYIAPERLVGVVEDFEREAKPQFWCWSKNNEADDPNVYEIRLIPIPDDVYSIEYFADIHPTTDVSSSPSSTVLPLHQEFIIAIKHRVRAYMLAYDNDYDGHDRYLQMFFSKVEQMKAKENSPRANWARMQVRDLSRAGDRRLARLDPQHFT